MESSPADELWYLKMTRECLQWNEKSWDVVFLKLYEATTKKWKEPSSADELGYLKTFILSLLSLCAIAWAKEPWADWTNTCKSDEKGSSFCPHCVEQKLKKSHQKHSAILQFLVYDRSNQLFISFSCSTKEHSMIRKCLSEVRQYA